MLNNIGLFLTRRTFLNPEREAYVDGNVELRLSFRQLNERCNRLANAYTAAGIESGERVGLLLMNSAEFIENFFALAKIGAESYQDFRDAAPAGEPPVQAAEDDMLFIMYTSGTTGLPKGVVHTHATVLWGILTIVATTYYSDTERYLLALPMFHVGALSPLIANIYRGATSIVMRSFDPRLTWQLMERENATSGLMVPAMLNAMLQVPEFDRFDRSSVKWLWVGAAPVPVNTIQAFFDLGIEIQQVYGLTETCGPTCLIDSENALHRIGSTGKAFFHTDVRIVRNSGESGESGDDCAAGEAGEVWVRGKHLMREYWNRPEATAECMVDGWFRSGDIAVMDEDGFVYIQDRIKDMIISGGENVYPAEIEGVLQGHPDISEAAVIGLTSEKWGESPLAIVVRTSSDLSEADVLAYCNGKLARYKQPCKAVFVDEIPRNPSGKILKRVLRKQFPGAADF